MTTGKNIFIAFSLGLKQERKFNLIVWYPRQLLIQRHLATDQALSHQHTSLPTTIKIKEAGETLAGQVSTVRII